MTEMIILSIEEVAEEEVAGAEAVEATKIVNKSTLLSKIEKKMKRRMIMKRMRRRRSRKRLKEGPRRLT